MEKSKFEDLLDKHLKQNPDFLSTEGEVLKDRVIDSAYKADRKLIELLLVDAELKKKFFSEIQGHWVFNINDFVMFVQDKHFLNDSYTKYKNKIGLTIEGKFLNERKEVALVWPFKDTVLEGGMTKEDQKKKEIFFNEILAQDEIDKLLAPKVLTKWKRYTVKGEEDVKELKRDENGTIKENLLIKGNNLLALHTLKEQFRGKVKLIYIDPPYNPEGNNNTFGYNNNFNHSTWLTFMKNRIDIAKQLLTKDGAMIIAIDKNEQTYLGVLIDECFKDYENHCITIVHNPRGVQGTNFSYTHEYAYFIFPENTKTIKNRKIAEEDIKIRGLRDNGGESLRTDAKNCFFSIIVDKCTKQVIDFGEVCDDKIHPKVNIHNGDFVEVYPIDKEGVERKWRYARQSIEKVKDLLVVSEKEGVYDIQIGKDFGQYRTVWVDKRYDANEYGTKLVKDLVPNSNFSFPKSLWNVYDAIYAVVQDDIDAIVLDYHAGSGTTGHAVLELNKEDKGNRKFILIEQMDYIETITAPRVQAVIKKDKINDNFVYAELLQHNESFVEEIENVKDTKALFKIWEQMKEKAFFKHNFEMQEFEKNIEEFKKLDLEKQKQVLFSVLDKNQLYVNYSEIEDKKFKIEKKDKEINKEFYGSR
ncbi:MAG: site-specific DNA-methyltransferase [Halobacteriovoraceae bacterium]|nr:site-specific DNA-methyltransferase [Halobacteriovoraceae bacterium]